MLSTASLEARPHVYHVLWACAVWVGPFGHAPLHRQRLEWKIFLFESRGGAVDMTGAEGQKRRQPLRSDRDGVADLLQHGRLSESE